MAEAKKSKEELRSRITEIKARVKEIDAIHAGEYLDPKSPDGQEWNAINSEHDEIVKAVAQMESREDRIRELEHSSEHAEDGSHFNVGSPRAVRGEDIYDLSTVRMTAASPHAAREEMHDRAKRAIEIARFPHENANKAACQEAVLRLLENDNRAGDFARQLLATGSPTYHRAFGKVLAGQPLTAQEHQALTYQAISETGSSGADGGYAVPYTLDPTVIPTSDQKVNPYRPISRTIQLVGAHEWRGVSSAGVVATRRNEGDESTDDSPKFAQPIVDVTRVDVFVPFSIELQQDWGAMSTEIAMLIQDAKDVEEATSFTTGNGTAPNPEGLLTGATVIVKTAATATFASTDLDLTEENLGARFQARAQWVGNRSTYNLVRHFATNNGPDLWVRIAEGLEHGGNTGRTLLGYAANEASAMPTGTTSGTDLLVLGDFAYFAIVDRVGMSIEVIPTLFGPNGRPTGQRGFYAVWRNACKVLAANAFRVLQAR